MGTKCHHQDYCYLNIMPLRCETPSHENCESFKYYNKYGSDPLSIGAMIVLPKGLEAALDG